MSLRDIYKNVQVPSGTPCR